MILLPENKILFLSICAVILASTTSSAMTVVGKAVSLTGEILIRNESPDAPAKMRKLKVADNIYKGDVMNTSSNASVKLLFTDKSVLDLGGSTLFKVDEYEMKNGSDRKVTMTMDYGKVRAAVNTPVGATGKYNIRTKTATMGVRGTEFIIASDLAEVAAPKPQAKGSGPGGIENLTRSAQKPMSVKTQITVVEGKVEVSENAAPKKAPVAVNKGEQLTTVSEVAGDKPVPKSVEAPAPKVVELSQEQMKTVVQEAKVEDKTFKQAVVLDKSMGGPSPGGAALADIGSSLASAPSFVPSPGQIGTPGTFGPTLTAQPNILPRSTVNLQVVFKK